ncbi:MAG: type III pantothenate kinase [Silvanigrellales bacterium]|nr:type III pantothenate kinase [Silvanigrellales bacterium]
MNKQATVFPETAGQVGVVDTCTSTQDVARQVAECGPAECGPAESGSGPSVPFAILARSQTAGRGRGGSSWQQAGAELGDAAPMNQSDALVLPKWHADLESALLDFDDFAPLTFAFPAESVLVPPAWLPIAVGCAIVDALRSTAGFLLSSFSDLPSHDVSAEDSMRLKWPNDVVMRVGSGPGGEPRYRKLAGVLCETSVQGGRFSTFLVGVGLNFFRAPDLDGAASFVAGLFASSLGKKSERSRVNRFLADASSRQIVLARFAQNLTKEMHEYVCVRRTSGQLRGLAVERSVPLGTVLSVNKGSVIGGFAGLAENGGLLLEGRHDPILAGDVALFEGLGSLTGGVNAVRPAESKGGRTSKGGKEAKDGKDEGTLAGRRVSDEPVPVQGKARPSVILDFGNTRVHWETADGAERLATGDAAWEEFDDVAFTRRPPDALRAAVLSLVPHKREALSIAFSTVGDVKRTRAWITSLETLLKSAFPELKTARVEATAGSLLGGTPLASRYDLSALGADRAARFLFCYQEARRLGAPVATVGAGTAFTLECVTPDGDILESLISPGWSMSLDAMHSRTARLPALAPEPVARPQKDDGPWTTAHSMQRGASVPIAATLAWLCQSAGVAEIVVSGGNGEAFLAHLTEALAAGGLSSKVALRALPTLERDVVRDLLVSGKLRTGWTLDKACVSDAPVAPLVLEDATEGVVDEETGAEDLLEAYRLEGRAPPEAMLRSMLRARVLKTKDMRLEPKREDFKKLGVRVENIAEEGERLDKHLAERYKFHNRETWQARVEAGEILVQRGAPKIIESTPPAAGLNKVKHTYRVKNLDQIWLFHPPEYEPDIMESCELVFDDGDTAVFSKPGNLVVHASGLYGKNTFLEVARKMGYAEFAPVHRLDRETSGALVCAKSSRQRHALATAFRNGQMHKMYVAVTRPVEGAAPVPDMFRVAHPIGPALGSRIRLKLWIDHPEAQESLTHVVRLAKADGFDLFACFPQTGRTNQIRIHLLSVGQWIVGDKMYHPDEEVFLRFYEEGLTPWVYERVLFPRHLLHNCGIEALGTGDESVAEPEGGIWGRPVVAPFTEDMMHYAPLVSLMQVAGIPVEQGAQKEWLLALFAKYGHATFANSHTYS